MHSGVIPLLFAYAFTRDIVWRLFAYAFIRDIVWRLTHVCGAGPQESYRRPTTTPRLTSTASDDSSSSSNNDSGPMEVYVPTAAAAAAGKLAVRVAAAKLPLMVTREPRRRRHSFDTGSTRLVERPDEGAASASTAHPTSDNEAALLCRAATATSPSRGVRGGLWAQGAMADATAAPRPATSDAAALGNVGRTRSLDVLAKVARLELRNLSQSPSPPPLPSPLAPQQQLPMPYQLHPLLFVPPVVSFYLAAPPPPPFATAVL
jgi:hypothetical protein